MNAIARYYIGKYRAQAQISGYEQAARNLRKQGVPLAVTLLILIYGERS